MKHYMAMALGGSYAHHFQLVTGR